MRAVPERFTRICAKNYVEEEIIRLSPNFIITQGNNVAKVINRLLAYKGKGRYKKKIGDNEIEIVNLMHPSRHIYTQGFRDEVSKLV